MLPATIRAEVRAIADSCQDAGMDPDAVTVRDYLILKVAAGVVLGGVVLYGLARLAGLPLVTPQASQPVPPAAVLSPAVEAAPVVVASPAPASPASPKAATPVVATPSPPAPASVAWPGSDSPPAPEATASPAASSPVTSGADAGSDAKATPRLEPVPEGYRCIDGRLFRVLPNGFEQLTDGSEKRYCG